MHSSVFGRQFEKELEDILAMGDSFYIWQSQKRRLIEITPQVANKHDPPLQHKPDEIDPTFSGQGQVAICDLIYQSAVVNEWGPLMQQVNFKGSILSSGPSYTHCKCVPLFIPCQNESNLLVLSFLAESGW
jgi:hypothetical protein